MTVTAPETIRQRVSAAVAAGLGAGAKESTNHPSLFPRDAASVAHLSYVVDMPDTEVTDQRRRMTTAGSSRDGDGSMAESMIRIQWTYRLRVDTSVADMDAATAKERDVFDALAAMDRSGIGPLVVRRVRRAAALVDGNAEYQLTTIELFTPHRYYIGGNP